MRDAEREALHARVRAFVAATAGGQRPAETFDELGLAIARRQVARVEGARRLCDAYGVDPARARSVRDLPAVPVEAFRLARVAAHPPEDDTAVFETSGTTGGAGGAVGAAGRGRHAMASTATYEAAAIAWGRWGLFPDDPPPMPAVVLAPPPGEAPRSSLGFMLARFAERWGLRPEWAVRGGSMDVGALHRVGARAREAGHAAVVMGTSFAFVHALDALAGRTIPLPPGSRAMQTGGFKGKSREVDPLSLRDAIARAFALDPRFVVGEYGMTELSSQLYEASLRAAIGLAVPARGPGTFAAPPWLRVVAVGGADLRPVPAGRAGLLRFEDLANVDSAVAIVTADVGRVVHEDGESAPVAVELLGRAAGAEPRGCALAIEEMLGPGRSGEAR